MVRSMPGHGCLITRNPPEPSGTGSPCMFTIAGTTPGMGRVAYPGFAAIAPGIGLIMMCPVSVCHRVSTIGQRSCPITSRYHIQASGLIGSQTVELVPLRPFVTPLNERADRRGRGVKDIHFVPVDNAPKTVRLGKIWRAFIHQAGGTIKQ